MVHAAARLHVLLVQPILRPSAGPSITFGYECGEGRARSTRGALVNATSGPLWASASARPWASAWAELWASKTWRGKRHHQLVLRPSLSQQILSRNKYLARLVALASPDFTGASKCTRWKPPVSRPSRRSTPDTVVCVGSASVPVWRSARPSAWVLASGVGAGVGADVGAVVVVGADVGAGVVVGAGARLGVAVGAGVVVGAGVAVGPGVGAGVVVGAGVGAVVVVGAAVGVGAEAAIDARSNTSRRPCAATLQRPPAGSAARKPRP